MCVHEHTKLYYVHRESHGCGTIRNQNYDIRPNTLPTELTSLTHTHILTHEKRKDIRVMGSKC